MNRLKIGIHLESLELPFRRALREVQRLGVTGVQVDAVGDLSPRALSETGQRQFLHVLGSYNLELTALGCPLRQGLNSPTDQQQRIDHTKSVLDLSVSLGVRIALVQTGRIPEKANDPSAFVLTEALSALGRHGERVGAVLAIETGLESGAVLRAFLDRFATGGLGVNLDPAGLLIHDFDPCESARALRDKVVHTQATDARQASTSLGSAQEVPLGHGDLDWARYLAVLEEIEYQGWLTVKRESGGNRVADVAAGVGFLGRFVGSFA
jgi:L-ribulose-5-phosphate 3-epimerase